MAEGWASLRSQGRERLGRVRCDEVVKLLPSTRGGDGCLVVVTDRAEIDADGVRSVSDKGSAVR
jgi:hypothetical protein